MKSFRTVISYLSKCFLVFVLIILGACQSPQNYESIAPPLRAIPESKDTIQRETINLTLLPKNELIWNGVKIKNASFEDSLTSLITRSIEDGPRTYEHPELGVFKRANYLINVHVDGKSTYGFYLETKERYMRIVDEIRQSYALKTFNLNYNELNSEQLIVINCIVDKAFIE